HAVLAAQDRRDVFVAKNAELDQTGGEPAAVGLLVVERFLQLRRRDALLTKQQFPETDGHVSVTRPSLLGAASRARSRCRSRGLRRAGRGCSSPRARTEIAATRSTQERSPVDGPLSGPTARRRARQRAS